MTGQAKRRRWAIPLVAVSLAVLAAGCGSREPHSSIVSAARGVVTSGSRGSADAGSSQSLGGEAAGSSVTTTTSGSTSAGAGVAGSGSAGAPSGGAVVGANVSSGSGSTATTAPAAAESTINIGNVGSYSGLIGAIFTGAQQSLQVWADYTNAHGGLNGHPVHIYSEDDGGDPSTNQTDTQQEVTQDHVIAFIGDLEPLTASANVSYLEQQSIPEIGGDAASAQWWQSPMLFPQASYIQGESDHSVREAVAAGYTKIGILYCIEDPTCTNGYTTLVPDGGAKAAGADVVYSASYSLTQPDFTAQCLAAQQAGATAIYFAGDGDSLIRMARDCTAQNYKPEYLADSIAVSAAVEADPLLNGLLSTQSDFPWTDSYTPAQATYQLAMKTYAPGLVGSATSAAEWTSGELAVAADKFLTATPTSAEFLQGLWSIQNNNLGGLAPPLTFNAHGLPGQPQCYFEMVLKNGTFVDTNAGNYQCT
jgi:branched-chain amino acid transport system substrate-binding protein